MFVSYQLPEKNPTKVVLLAAVVLALATVIAFVAPKSGEGIANSTVVITATYPNAAAEMVEHDLLSPLEGVVGRTSGLRRMEGVAEAGSARIEATYARFSRRDTAELLQLVRGAVLELKPRLPNRVETLEVSMAVRPSAADSNIATDTDWLLLAAGAAFAGIIVLFIRSSSPSPRCLSYVYDRLLERFHDALASTLRHRTRAIAAAVVAVFTVVATYAAVGTTRPLSSNDRADIHSRSDMEIDVWGADTRLLAGVAQRLIHELQQIPGVNNVRSSVREGEIDHRDGARWANVRANLDAKMPEQTEHRVRDALATIQLPPGHRLEVGGSVVQARMMITRIAVIAVVLILAILAWRYASLLLPVVLAIATLFSFAGALLALLLTGRALSPWICFAVAPSVAIVIAQGARVLAVAARRHKAGAILRVTLVDAGRAELRPALVLTSTVCAALLPLALLGGEQWATASVAAIGSVLAAGVTVLFVVPALFDGAVAMLMRAREGGFRY